MDLDYYDWSWRATSFLERNLARRADRIVANSYAGRDVAVASGLPGDRLMVIPNGIDTVLFKPDTTHRAVLRAEWNVPEDAFLIGKIARLDPMKDHRTFLRAAARVSARETRFRFVCVGDGPSTYADALRRDAEKLGLGDALVWAGARSDMNSVYGALDAVTLSSAFGEGFPNAVGEAMACGRSCVVTDVGDSAQIVADTGIVVEPGDAVAIALGGQILADESPAVRHERGGRCRARIVEAYSLTAMIDAHARLYRDTFDMVAGYGT